MTDLNLAYYAGILDCMGGIRTRVASGTELPFIYCHTPNLPVLRYLSEQTGTKVTYIRREYAKAGCALHCPDKHQHVYSEAGRWSLTGAKATIVLHNLMPYLHFQTGVATDALELGLSAPFKPATLTKMQELGWNLPEWENERPLKSITAA